MRKVMHVAKVANSPKNATKCLIKQHRKHAYTFTGSNSRAVGPTARIAVTPDVAPAPGLQPRIDTRINLWYFVA